MASAHRLHAAPQHAGSFGLGTQTRLRHCQLDPLPLSHQGSPVIFFCLFQNSLVIIILFKALPIINTKKNVKSKKRMDIKGKTDLINVVRLYYL